MARDRLLHLFTHQFLCFSFTSFCFCYSYVWQTKLASFLVNFWVHNKIALIDRLKSTRKWLDLKTWKFQNVGCSSPGIEKYVCVCVRACVSRHIVVIFGIARSSRKRRVNAHWHVACRSRVSHVDTRWRVNAACSDARSIPKQCPPSNVSQQQSGKTENSIQHVEWGHCHSVTCLRLATHRWFS